VNKRLNFYQSGQINLEITGNQHWKLLQGAGQPLAERRDSHSGMDIQLLITDSQKSVLKTHGGLGAATCIYTAYGHDARSQPAAPRLGFAGEPPEPLTGNYLLVHELEPALWAGDYENDPVFRETVQAWVNQLWVEKDQRIEQLRAEMR